MFKRFSRLYHSIKRHRDIHRFAQDTLEYAIYRKRKDVIGNYELDQALKLGMVYGLVQYNKGQYHLDRSLK